MTPEELKIIFESECVSSDEKGLPVINKSPLQMLDWINSRVLRKCQPPFSKAFTGMHDKHGKAIHEGDMVRIYYKGTYVICQVIYDIKHAAFFIRWPDGYVNQYFMNGSNYEVVTADHQPK